MADTVKSFLRALLNCLEMNHVFQGGLHSHVAPTRESHEPGKSDLRKLNVGRVFRQNKSQVIPRAFFFFSLNHLLFLCCLFSCLFFSMKIVTAPDQSEFAVFLCFAVSALHT